MFWLQHQFNNIVEQHRMIRCQNSIVTANVRSVHRQLQATTPASSRVTERISSLRNLLQPYRSVLVAGCPDNLKHFLEFGSCFWLCFKLAVSLQHCTPYVIVYLGLYSANLEAIDILWWYLDSWPAASSVCCAVCCVCWRAILLDDESGGQPAIALKER